MSDGFPALRPNEYRDTWCGQVLPDRVDSEVRVAGWVHRRRDHGGLVFIDLRDRTGLVQLVFNPDEAGAALDARGNVQASVDDYRTTVARLFAAGDMRRGQSLVVWAIREGRQCARAIDEFLMGSTTLPR